MFHNGRLTDTDQFGQLHRVVWFTGQTLENLATGFVLQEVQGLIEVSHTSQLEVG